MDMNEYQDLALRTANARLDDKQMLANWALGLSGEAGETADLIKKHLFHGHPLDKDKIKSELGDIMWYIATMSRSLGMDMNEIAEHNVDKLRARYPEGFSETRSRERES